MNIAIILDKKKNSKTLRGSSIRPSWAQASKTGPTHFNVFPGPNPPDSNQ